MIKEPFTEFDELCKSRGMGWIHQSYPEGNQVVFEVSFGKSGTNYKETGYVSKTYSGNFGQGTLDSHIRNYKNCIRILKETN